MCLLGVVLTWENMGQRKPVFWHILRKILQEKNFFSATFQCLKRCYERPFGGLQNIFVPRQNDMISKYIYIVNDIGDKESKVAALHRENSIVFLTHFRPCSTLFQIINTAQETKFSIKDFFSKCDQIRRKLRIWLHLLNKSLMENFIRTVQGIM